MKGGETIFTDSKYRAAPDFAITHKEDNDTPVQSQSEREKTVAGNEGGSVRTTVGVELPWRQFAADRLATSLRETHWYLGVSRTNRDHISQTKGGHKNRDIVKIHPTLNTSLRLAAYIGRKHLSKSYWEVKHNGKNY